MSKFAIARRGPGVSRVSAALSETFQSMFRFWLCLPFLRGGDRIYSESSSRAVPVKLDVYMALAALSICQEF